MPHALAPGKTSEFIQTRMKTYSMHAKLNDKNIEQLSGSAAVDTDFGMATPCALESSPSAAVKVESPSVQKLKEMNKAVKSP